MIGIVICLGIFATMCIIQGSLWGRRLKGRLISCHFFLVGSMGLWFSCGQNYTWSRTHIGWLTPKIVVISRRCILHILHLIIKNVTWCQLLKFFHIFTTRFNSFHFNIICLSIFYSDKKMLSHLNIINLRKWDLKLHVMWKIWIYNVLA